MAWLEANRTLVISDFHSAFLAEFNRLDVTAAHLHSLRKRMGWKVGRAGGRYCGRHRLFSAEEIAWLSEHRGLVISQYHTLFVERFARSDVSASSLNALRKRQGWRTGSTGRFSKGQVSWNKGRRCEPGCGGLHPNARKTQFKAGSRTGRASALYQPIGTERITKDGYRQRKMHDGMPMHSRWQLVQRVEWERINGPVPDGHALKCLNGNKLDTDSSNWEAVPRAVLARLNGGRHKRRIAYDAAPPEVRPALLTLAKLEHRLFEGGAA